MKRLRSVLPVVLAACCLLLATGCNPLRSNQPLGEKPLTLDKDDLNGRWVSASGWFEFLVTDATNGLAVAAWIEKQDNDLKLQKATLAFRQTGDTVFANVVAATDTNYVSVVLKAKFSGETDSKNTLILWGGEVEPLRLAGKKGLLSFADTNQLVIATNFVQAARFLDSPEGAALFDLTSPLVFIRMPR